MYTVPFFPAGRSGALPPPTRGLAEWHPVGCFLGEGELGELGLEGYGGSEGVDDPLVVRDIVKGEGGIASVLQPLLCRLVATDVVVPYLFRHITEVLLLIDPHLALQSELSQLLLP